MSYILAALKKSEQERNQLEADSNTPLESTVSSAATPPYQAVAATSNNTKLIVMVSCAVLILLSAFLFVKPMLEVARHGEGNMATVAAVETVEPSIINPAVIDPDVVIAQIAVKKARVRQAPVTKELEKKMVLERLVDEPLMEAVEIEAVEIEQGNLEQLAKVPSISVTSHIYSSQADRRSIVVNDQRLVEGDFVANQVQVKEITHQGMILEVDGFLFSVSRSRGWNR